VQCVNSLDACVPVAQPVVADNPVGNSATYPLTVERGGCRLRCYRDATSLSKEENDDVVARSWAGNHAIGCGVLYARRVWRRLNAPRPMSAGINIETVAGNGTEANDASTRYWPTFVLVPDNRMV